MANARIGKSSQCGKDVRRQSANEPRLQQEGSETIKAVTMAGTSTPVDRRRAIAEYAYLLSERRGFAPGYELDDWLAAEKEVDRFMIHGTQSMEESAAS